jgi:hypothetical protein
MAGARQRREYLGEEAARFVMDSVAEGKVRLESDPAAADRDAEGRLQRYVFLEDGRLLNAELLARGLAYADVKGALAWGAELHRMEQQARRRQIGLWDSRRWQRQRSAERTQPLFLPTPSLAPLTRGELGQAARARRRPLPPWEVRKREFEERLKKLGQPQPAPPPDLLTPEECRERCRREKTCKADSEGQ